MYRTWKYGCYGTGWFHMFYWSCKTAASMMNDDICYRHESRAGKVVMYTLFATSGVVFGVINTIIWPVSTPLTIINIDERVEKDQGFFFWRHEMTGLNKRLYRVWKAIFY